MAHVQLAVSRRDSLGSAATRRLRRQGLVPGVLYQAGTDSVPVQANAREVRRVMHTGGRTSVIDLAIGDSAPVPTLLKDWQLDPVRDDVVHFDLQQVNLSETVEADIPVSLTGTPAGVRDGGVLDQPLRSVTVRALPDALPDSIDHDVAALGGGEALHVSDLVAPEGVEILDDPEAVVASVMAPSGVGEAEEEAGPGEPELVGGREGQED